MDFTDLDDEIAAVAHRCWCKSMLADGWRSSKVFDPGNREHDAIRPYHELPLTRRAQVRRLANWVDLERHLRNALYFDMMFRSYSAQDLYLGMRVHRADDQEGDIGRIVGWEVADEEAGMLDVIRVEWPNGKVVEHAPSELELIMVDEL